MALETLHKSNLKVGMYVELPLAWFDHPFATSKFKIKDAAALKQVQAIGKLSEVQWDPERSSILDDTAADVFEVTPEVAPVPKPIPEQELARAELKSTRMAINRLESKVSDLSQRIVHLMPNLTSGGPLGLESATALAHEVADDLVSDPAEVMQLVSLTGEQDHYFARHTINVTALAVMVARALNMTAEQVHEVARGAFLHDVGVTRLPTQITRKKQALSDPEQGVYEGHSKIGSQLFGEDLPHPVREMIRLHHARIDGSGYPPGQSEKSIPLPAQIVGLADHYDRLCNPARDNKPLSPSDAVKHLFARERRKFSRAVLDTFIRCLGVYPPGTLVGLDDDRVGVVVMANPREPLSPQVVVYDPQVRRTDAIPLDLALDGAPGICTTYLPDQLPAVMAAYLALSARSHYYLIASVDADILASADSMAQ